MLLCIFITLYKESKQFYLGCHLTQWKCIGCTNLDSFSFDNKPAKERLHPGPRANFTQVQDATVLWSRTKNSCPTVLRLRVFVVSSSPTLGHDLTLSDALSPVSLDFLKVGIVSCLSTVGREHIA